MEAFILLEPEVQVELVEVVLEVMVMVQELQEQLILVVEEVEEVALLMVELLVLAEKELLY